MLQNPPDYRHDTVLPLPAEVTADAWAVDASCPGNPGPMEYQGIDLATGQRLFHFGPMRGVQRNMILAHMFPLCREMPRSSGAWMLTLADKRCACEDYLGASKRFRPIYDEIDRRAAL